MFRTRERTPSRNTRRRCRGTPRGAEVSAAEAGTRRLRRAGFTLLETLLATVIFVSGFLALSGCIQAALSAGGNNESLLVGVNLAREKMETIHNTSYASVANEAKAAVSGFSSFEREVTVAVPQTDLKRVTVTVYWTNKSNELSTSLVTYVANP